RAVARLLLRRGPPLSRNALCVAAAGRGEGPPAFAEAVRASDLRCAELPLEQGDEGGLPRGRAGGSFDVHRAARGGDPRAGRRRSELRPREPPRQAGGTAAPLEGGEPILRCVR